MGTAACAPPDTSDRGFGSTQVLHVRDKALSLRSTFSLDESAIYVAHMMPDVTVPDGVAAPYDRTLITFATGVEQKIASGVLGVQLLRSADGLGRTMVMWHFPPDYVIPPSLPANALQDIDLTFLDEVTNIPVTLSDVDGRSVDLGSTQQDPILIKTKSADDNSPWLMGRPGSLVPMPSGLNQLLGRDPLGFVGTSEATDGSNNQAFTRIPFDGSAPRQLIPGALTNPQQVSGADTFLSAPTVVPRIWDGQRIFCFAPSDSSPNPPCALFYDRRFIPNDSGRLPFVHLLDTGRDLQLPGRLSNKLLDVLSIAPTGWDTFWRSPLDATGATGGTDAADATVRIYAWHVGQDHAASCDIEGIGGKPFAVDAWRSLPPGQEAGPTTAGQFAVVAQPGSQTSETPGSWTLITGTTGVECHVVTQRPNLISPQGGLAYAPDGSALALLETDPIGVSKIYVTDGDAAGPLREVAKGAYFFNMDFHDPRHLLLWHSNTDGYSVSWLDFSSTPAVEHPIADRVVWDARSSWAWINPRWVLLADADSPQDGSYSLHVVDLETGTSKLISRGVVEFRTPWTTPPPGATALTVAYVVRSRSPSSQDGLWMARLPLSDFPP